jgi:ribosomal protein S18 acetylase RimI-like enzyme
MSKTDFFYVAQDQNNIVGFLIAYPDKLLDPNNDIQKQIINDYIKENSIYIFQIAVSPRYQ